MHLLEGLHTLGLSGAEADALWSGEALAEKVEPVAWMRPSTEGYDSAFRDNSTVAVSKATGATHWDDDGWVPLYAAHPAPARQPLTLEQIDKHIGADEGDREAVIEIVREVEAMHGIVNVGVVPAQPDPDLDPDRLPDPSSSWPWRITK